MSEQWFYDNYTIRETKTGKSIASIIGQASIKQMMKHRSLVVAAPELLDFAKGARDMARRVLNEQGHDDELSIEEVYEWIRNIILEPSEAIILKATGK